MYNLVVILMGLVCFSFILKQTWHKTWSIVLHAGIAALFTGLMYPLAIEQSRSHISEWMSDTGLMLDISVVITLEVIIQMSFCLLSAHLLNTGRLKKSTVMAYRFLRWFPSLLILPVLFSILVSAIFSFPGVPFALTAWGLAATVFAASSGIALALRWLLPEKETRLELLFLSNVLIEIIAIVVTVNGKTAVEGTDAVEWASFFRVIGLIAAGWFAGLLIERYIRPLFSKQK